jgi:hypothetical protein
MWHATDFSAVTHAAGRNGTTKFSVDGKPFRFQVPRGKVLFGGLSGYKSITIETSAEFADWWRSALEVELAKGLTPFKSNMSGTSLRLKVDPSTQIFDANRQIKFPELVEGTFAGQTVTCIAEIVGTYFFQETFGLTCRIYQLIERLADVQEEEEEETVAPIKGFAFLP